MKKNRSLKIMLCALFVLVACFVLAACNKQEKRPFDWLITFNYNAGNLRTTPIKDQYLGVMDNSLIGIRPGYKPGSGSTLEEVAITGYYVEGWYTADSDVDGNLIMVDFEGHTPEENGVSRDDEEAMKDYVFVKLGEKWDFANWRVKNDVTLYAKIAKQAQIHYIDIETGEECGGIMAKPGTERDVPTSSRMRPTKENYTWMKKYYTDETRDEEFTWPYVFQKEDINIYVDMIEGVWELVDSASDFASKISSNSNIWLLNDITFQSEDDLWSTGSPYNATINGNGHTVSGITRKLVINKNSNDQYAGAIFGVLGERTKIYDITFEVSYDYKVGSSVSVTTDLTVGVLAWEWQGGAESKIDNVTVTGTVTYDSKNGLVEVNKKFGKDTTGLGNTEGYNADGVTLIPRNND